MEALDTTLYEEGTQVPLNPSTTSGQVRHKETTVSDALDALEADGSVTTARLAKGAVTTEKIANDAVTKNKLAMDSVTTPAVMDGTITEPKLGDFAVTKDKIFPLSVTEGKIAAGAVVSAKIADGAVGNSKIAQGAVTESKIADGSVSTRILKDKSVTSGKIADGAVGAANIADDAVTTAKLDKVVRDKISAATDYTIPVTWEELKSLRDGGELIPGQTYRITDFVTTSVQSETRSAGHAFDVIVVADDESTLNENAHACQHEGDTYFEGVALNAWELKYCLDNDAERFAWADETNGKGVIWWMRDEWDNECFYDFKNIQYKRYKVTSTHDNTADLVGSCPYLGNINQNSIGLSESDTSDFKWVYTFTKYTQEGDLIEDGSLVGRMPEGDYGTLGGCYGNKIGSLYVSVSKDDGDFVRTLTLNNGVYWTNGYSPDYGNDWHVICFLNRVEGDCHDFTGLQGVVNTTCGNGCDSWTCGNDCYGWTCGNGCDSWTCGNDCYYWTCGNGCDGWTCGNEVSGTKVLQDYVSYFRLESGVSNITIKSSATPTSSKPLKNFVVKAGIKGASSSSKTAIVIDTASFPLGSDYEWIIAKNSKGAIKQYCEADLIN